MLLLFASVLLELALFVMCGGGKTGGAALPSLCLDLVLDLDFRRLCSSAEGDEGEIVGCCCCCCSDRMDRKSRLKNRTSSFNDRIVPLRILFPAPAPDSNDVNDEEDTGDPARDCVREECLRLLPDCGFCCCTGCRSRWWVWNKKCLSIGAGT